MAVDPWAGANQGIDSLSNSMLQLAQLKRQDTEQAQRSSLLDLQKQQTQQGIDQNNLTLADLNAQRGALVDQYGTKGHANPYASAVSFQQQEGQDAKAMEAEQKGLEVYLNTIKAIDSMPNIDAGTKTGLAKHLLAQNPKYAPFAENLKFIDPKGVKAAKMYKDGELTDPVTGQPLPAGYYETEGRWTGNAAKPVELVAYKQAEPPKPSDQETWGEPEQMSVGGKTAIVQKSSRGQIRPVIQDTAPRITVNGGHANNTDFRNESAMRKEFLSLPEVKDFPTIESNSKRAVAALRAQGGSNVAVDQTIITVFNKMLDPTSVVRESEYARTPQDLSVLSRIKGKWDKVQHGGAGLDKTEREALARMVGNFTEIAGQQYNDQVTYYSDLARRYGYKPENVVRLGGRKSDLGGGAAIPESDAGAFVKQQYAEYRKAGVKEDQIRQRVSSKLRKAGWKDSQITAALRENADANGAVVTSRGFKVTRVD